MRNILLFIGSLLLLITPTAAQTVVKKPAWKSGVVVAYSYESATKELPVEYTDLSVDVTDSRRTQQREIVMRDDHLRMQVRTEDGLYYVSENLKYIWQKKLDLKEGDAVKVLSKKGRIQIRTDKGKKAKYRYVLFVPKEFVTGN